MKSTEYKGQLRDILKDPMLWPDFDSPDFVDRLEAVAERAINRQTVDGKLAAMLIYHQLVEEMIKLINEDRHLLVLLLLGLSQSEIESPDGKTNDRHLQELSSVINSKEYSRFGRLSNELSCHRIHVVHNLVRGNSLEGLTQDAQKAKRLYEQCFQTFEGLHGRSRLIFDEFRNDLM